MALIAPVTKGEIENNKTVSKNEPKSNELGYDQFLTLLCAEMQYQDPLEPTSNTEYVAQLATFSQMEATLGMKSTIESSNANSLVGKYVIVKSTSATTGEMTGEAGFVDYVEYDNGKQYFYVNGNRYGMENIYQIADTDYIEAITLANAFKASVDKLPNADKLTLSDRTDVEQLTKVFESLNSFQKSYIDEKTMEKFSAVVNQMNSMVGTENAKDFTASVDKLPSVDEITLDSKEEIERLRKLYDSIPEDIRKDINSDTLKKFEELEAKIKELGGDSSEGSDKDESKTE